MGSIQLRLSPEVLDILGRYGNGAAGPLLEDLANAIAERIHLRRGQAVIAFEHGDRVWFSNDSDDLIAAFTMNTRDPETLALDADYSRATASMGKMAEEEQLHEVFSAIYHRPANALERAAINLLRQVFEMQQILTDS